MNVALRAGERNAYRVRRRPGRRRDAQPIRLHGRQMVLVAWHNHVMIPFNQSQPVEG